MRIYLLSATVLASVFANVAGFDVPQSFGCKNSMISDDWRRAVLKFHNDGRRRVALGQQRTKGGVMPMAKKMNELVWDCTLEHNAWLNLCDPTVTIDQTYAETEKKALKTNGSPCNLTTNSLDILRGYWKESEAVDLKNNPQYSIDIQNFGLMAAEGVKGFACTYNKCAGTSQTNFICLYDQKLAGGNLYETAANEREICDNCAANNNNPKCIDRLCQYEYKLASKANPQPICTDDEMTRDMQDAAVYMHNYYRKTVATGWGKDKTGYAPRAKTMIELEYDCKNAGKNTLAKLDCTKKYSADPGYSLNYKEFKLEVSPEDALKEAISAWYAQLESIELDNQATYKEADNAKNFANMMVGNAKTFGCAAKKCPIQGFTVAACQYDTPPDDGSPLYEVGKPCTGCAGTGYTKCSSVDGLCQKP